MSRFYYIQYEGVDYIPCDLIKESKKIILVRSKEQINNDIGFVQTDSDVRSITIIDKDSSEVRSFFMGEFTIISEIIEEEMKYDQYEIN